MKRFQTLNSSKSFLVNKLTKNIIRLDNVPAPFEEESIILQSVEPKDGQISIKLRKGTTNEKDIFIEVWNEDPGFVSSLKVTDNFKMIYNDSAFGGIKWSRDKTRIIFIGEKPEIASFIPLFKDEEGNKVNDEDSLNDKKAEDHWQDEKFLYKEHFGETLIYKQRPAIFIFDLVLNKLK